MKNSKNSFYFFPLKAYTATGKAAVTTLIIIAVYTVVEILFKYFAYNIVSTWEILQLFVMYATFGLFKKIFSDSRELYDFKGNLLPTDISEESCKIRNKYYRISALIYSLIFAVINFCAFLLSLNANGMLIISSAFIEKQLPALHLAAVSTLISFALIYLLSYMFEYIWGERKTKSLNKQIEDITQECNIPEEQE